MERMPITSGLPSRGEGLSERFRVFQRLFQGRRKVSSEDENACFVFARRLGSLDVELMSRLAGGMNAGEEKGRAQSGQGRDQDRA
jgi:hypothetical protein